MREKIACLVTLLVTAVGLILPRHLFDSTRELVEEHEIVDLRDEASLRAWELVGRIDTLVEDVRVMSRDVEWIERAISDGLTEDWASGLQNRVRGKIDEYVRCELLGTSGEVLARPGGLPLLLEGVENSIDWRAKLLAEIRGGGEPGEVLLSPIHHTVTEWGGHPKPVILAGVLTGPGAGDPVLLVLLDLGSIVGTNLTDPRHLYLLAREEGEEVDGRVALSLAVHPDESLALRGAPLAEDNVFEPAAGVIEALEESKPNVQSAEAAVQGIAHRLSGVPLARDYYFVEGKPDARLARIIEVLMERMGEEEELGNQILDFLQEFRRDMGGNTRVQLPQNAVSQLRVLARSRETAEQVLEEFPLRLAEILRRTLDVNPPPDLYGLGERSVIDWGKPTRCQQGDIWMVHLRLRGDGNEHAYRLAYVGFREELNYAITQELGGLRIRALLFGLLAGLVSFAAALWFVRPLDRVTRTAGSAADSAALREQMQQKINEVRESLPVKRRDEVGDIARALERLLREVLSAHERLRQAKLDLDLQVAEQTQELRDKNEQLQRLAQDKDAFLGNVSHELRQPLNALFGFTQLLELSDLDDEQRQDLGKVRKEAKHLLDLINDILDYQKIIMDGLDLEPEAIPLAEFLAEMRDTMRGAAEKEGNRLLIEADHAPPTIFNDRKRLRQVLANLLGNACKFTREGTITLAAVPRQSGGRDWVEFRIEDTGRGMKPEEMTRLFTKFAKLSAKEGNAGGTGLGLVISKGLCELMGGEVTVESQFGKGSTFVVRLPEKVGEDDEEGDDAAAQTAVAEPPPEHPRRSRPLVLVVDDDESVRELVGRFLGESEMDVISAAGGREALALATSELPDVITLDAVMPEMDGWDVLSGLKSNPTTAAIPVVMVSFLDQDDRGYALGASDYVVKPIDWNHLASVIERHLGEDRDSAILVVDDDESTRNLFRRTLEKRDWKVWQAENGKAALELMAEKLPALILLDLMMPVMDGFEFIEKFRGHPEWNTIPVVVVTAADPSEDEKRLLEGSVVKVLQKGAFEQKVLLGEIQTQVERRLRSLESDSKKLSLPS